MKSKASYFSISKPLIVENLRRFWAIPALAFLVYFLSGVFPILMSYSHLNDMYSYIRMSMINQQPFYMFAHLMFPVMAAVVIFRYLQGVSSVSVMHSMPFTRAKLYNSGFISGLILIAAPILANGLILLAISKPVYRQYGTNAGLVTETIDQFSRAGILNWIWVSLLIAFVVYAVSVFAGMVTGNGLMHFATALWFNFLIPALYAVFIFYFSRFLYGFDTSGNWEEYGLRISPFLNVLQSEGVFGVGETVYYIVSFLILYAITLFLYQKRKLERAAESLVFGFMEPVICYLIAFFGMTLLGLYFDSLGDSELYFYAGLAAGTVIFFIIGQMIVKKTPRIYNVKSLKSVGVYTLIAVLFLLGLNFDVTGFERRVPSPGKISGFALYEEFTIGGKFGAYTWNDDTLYKKSGDENGFRLKDPGNIEAVTALHQTLIDNKARFESMKNILQDSVYLKYNPDSAISMTRRYLIDYDFYRNSGEFKQIYESKEFKDYFSPLNLNYTGLTRIYVNSEIPFRESVEIESQADMQEFMACLDQDFKAQTFEDLVSLKHPYATAAIDYKYKNANSDTPERLLDNSINYRITESYANTIEWLAAHGYGSRFVQAADDVESIELYHYVQPEDMAAAGAPGAAVVQDRAMPYGKVTVEGQELEGLTVTDPVRIQELLDTYETQNTNYQDYYYGIVIYKGSGEPPSDQYYLGKYGYIPDAAEKYKLEPSVSTMQIYFNEGNIPDFVLEYFKNK